MKNFLNSIKENNNLFYINPTKKLSINLLILPVFYAAYRFEYLSIMTASFLTAFFHELFHIAAIKLTGNHFKKIVLEPFGISAIISDISFFNSKKEMFISLAGPFFNFIAAFLLYILNDYIKIQNTKYLITLNLSMGIFNLIPALPLDGGRFLRAYLSPEHGIIHAYNFMIRQSRIIIFVLLTLSAFLIIFSSFNFSLIIIAVFMLSNLCCEKESLNKVILKNILTSKLAAQDVLSKKTKVITVFASSPARSILKNLSFDYYLDIVIIEKTGKVLAVTTETEVVNFLISSGIRSKFKDMLT